LIAPVDAINGRCAAAVSATAIYRLWRSRAAV
jgi:hypothetical protein